MGKRSYDGGKSASSIALKRAKEMRKREKKKAPKVKVKDIGESCLLTVSAKERKSIVLPDIRHLLASSLLGNQSPDGVPRWCHLEKIGKIPQTALVILDGLTLNHFITHFDSFGCCKEIFLTRLDTVMPLYRKGQTLQELTEIPIKEVQRDELVKKHGSLEKALEVENFLVEEERIEINHNRTVEDKFSRLKLLLSPLQMIDSNFPIPQIPGTSSATWNYVFTKDVYAPVTSQSPMFAMDCEMVMTSFGFTEVVRVSVVNEACESIYETFVRPQRPVIDYKTQFSGVTAQIIENATKTLKDVQEDLKNLLPADAILVGHSLNADLKALRMIHPYVIDTSIIYNVREDRKSSKLQELTKMFLDETIQSNPLGHDSIEDSIASMKLVKKKLSGGLQFGDHLLEKLLDKGYDVDSLGGLSEAAQEKTITGNLLGHLMTQKPEARINIIASLGTSQDYEKFFPLRLRESDKISISVKKSNKSAVTKTCASLPEATLSVTHLAIESEKLAEDQAKATLAKVDQWIHQIWSSVAVHGLVVVIFTGSRESRSGLSLVEFRKVDFVDKQEIISKVE
ncbi:RNA exonuclease 5-like [Phlebotomus argentipes]|uniref:RNA exonuclease 5-like n=1 Tax=Phlebotomus argentipes TaxID=94469 RepID=UPI002893666C|nr:RNA exonuclease 5-like [Phlebotomus argentipes]